MMDTTKQYILMCEKAKGDLGEPGYKYGDLWSDDGERVLVVLPNHFPVANCIPVYRQDQLQEMVKRPLGDLIFEFMCFCYDPVGGGCFEGRTTYTEQFTSMEQLWLAFVMHGKGKVWNWDKKEWSASGISES